MGRQRLWRFSSLLFVLLTTDQPTVCAWAVFPCLVKPVQVRAGALKCSALYLHHQQSDASSSSVKGLRSLAIIQRHHAKVRFCPQKAWSGGFFRL